MSTDDVESCNDCECHDEKLCDSGKGDYEDSQLKYYRDNATNAISKQIQPNTVTEGLAANPYRTSAIFTNIGTTILLIRNHPTNTNPTVAGPTSINRVLMPNRSWEPDCKCYRRLLQGFICIVNTDTALVGTISIFEQLSKPDTEPVITGGRYGNI